MNDESQKLRDMEASLDGMRSVIKSIAQGAQGVTEAAGMIQRLKGDDLNDLTIEILDIGGHTMLAYYEKILSEIDTDLAEYRMELLK